METKIHYYIKLALSWCYHHMPSQLVVNCDGTNMFRPYKTNHTTNFFVGPSLHINLYVTHTISAASYRKIKWVINTKVTQQASMFSKLCYYVFLIKKITVDLRHHSLSLYYLLCEIQTGMLVLVALQHNEVQVSMQLI